MNIAVLLLNMGGPDSLDSIYPFLKNLFSDKEIIKLPLQPVLSKIIAKSRAKKVRGRYEAIGGGSPINRLTQEQAWALGKLLNSTDDEHKYFIFIGMRYWHPLIEDSLKKISEGDFEEIIILPMFPQYSMTTTGSCFNVIKNSKLKDYFKSAVFIDSWYDNQKFIDAVTEKVEKGLNRFKGIFPQEDIKVVFSAHSIPQNFVDKGDPYPKQVEQTVDEVVERTGITNWMLTYQSRSGPVKWLEPNTEEVLKELAEKGTKAILVVPISFVSDHIETLYEIDIMFKQMCKSLGVEQFERSESLNSSHIFIEALADIILKSLKP